MGRNMLNMLRLQMTESQDQSHLITISWELFTLEKTVMVADSVCPSKKRVSLLFTFVDFPLLITISYDLINFINFIKSSLSFSASHCRLWWSFWEWIWGHNESWIPYVLQPERWMLLDCASHAWESPISVHRILLAKESNWLCGDLWRAVQR